MCKSGAKSQSESSWCCWPVRETSAGPSQPGRCRTSDRGDISYFAYCFCFLADRGVHLNCYSKSSLSCRFLAPGSGSKCLLIHLPPVWGLDCTTSRVPRNSSKTLMILVYLLMTECMTNSCVCRPIRPQ